ncbi:unnamed protein product [Linum tenue]
MRARI